MIGRLPYSHRGLNVCVCRSFGKPGTQYDFAVLDIDALQIKAGELEENSGV